MILDLSMQATCISGLNGVSNAVTWVEETISCASSTWPPFEPWPRRKRRAGGRAETPPAGRRESKASARTRPIWWPGWRAGRPGAAPGPTRWPRPFDRGAGRWPSARSATATCGCSPGWPPLRARRASSLQLAGSRWMPAERVSMPSRPIWYDVKRCKNSSQAGSFKTSVPSIFIIKLNVSSAQIFFQNTDWSSTEL